MSLRQVHRYLALLSAIPFFVILTTGILLSLSPKIEWLQPHAPALSSGISLSFDEILTIAKTIPAAQISTWDDVAQIDARPASGIVRVRSENYWEIQIDGKSGKVMKAAPRWKTPLVLLHDGTLFSSWTKTWVFFPTGVCALILWVTGMLIWLKTRRSFGGR